MTCGTYKKAISKASQSVDLTDRNHMKGGVGQFRINHWLIVFLLSEDNGKHQIQYTVKLQMLISRKLVICLIGKLRWRCHLSIYLTFVLRDIRVK